MLLFSPLSKQKDRHKVNFNLSLQNLNNPSLGSMAMRTLEMLISCHLFLKLFFMFLDTTTHKEFLEFARIKKEPSSCWAPGGTGLLSHSGVKGQERWVFLSLCQDPTKKRCLGWGNLERVNLFHTLCPPFQSRLWNCLSEACSVAQSRLSSQRNTQSHLCGPQNRSGFSVKRQRRWLLAFFPEPQPNFFHFTWSLTT